MWVGKMGRKKMRRKKMGKMMGLTKGVDGVTG